MSENTLSQQDGENGGFLVIKQHKRKRSVAPSHEACEKCMKSTQKKTGGPSPWMTFLKSYQMKNPGMSQGQAQIEARKRYVGPSGRKKSYERIFREVWRAKNPAWKTLYPGPEKLDPPKEDSEATQKMREDFINLI